MGNVLVISGNEYWIRISGNDGATGDFVLNIAGPDCELPARRLQRQQHSG